jgi:hypothetical protein
MADVDVDPSSAAAARIVAETRSQNSGGRGIDESDPDIAAPGRGRGPDENGGNEKAAQPT